MIIVEVTIMCPSKVQQHDTETSKAADLTEEERLQNEIRGDAAVLGKSTFSKLSRLPGFGIFSGLLSAFFYALISFIVKKLDDIHPIQISLSRSCVQFLFLMPLMTYKRNKIDILGPKGLQLPLWLQGLFGSCAALFLYFAIGEMSVGNAVTVASSSLIFVPIMGRIVLKEALTVFDIIFSVVALIGVVFIAQPTVFLAGGSNSSQANAIGILFALLSALFQSTTVIMLRFLKDSSALLNMLYYCICSAATTIILLFSLHEFSFPCMHEVPYLFMLGVFGNLGQVFFVLSVQKERAGTAIVLKSFQLIFVYLLQITVLKNIPTSFSLIGASLVFSSSVGIGVRKIWNERKRRNSNGRRN